MSNFDNILFEMTTVLNARRDAQTHQTLRELREDALFYARRGMTHTMNNVYRDIRKLVGAEKHTESN